MTTDTEIKSNIVRADLHRSGLPKSLTRTNFYTRVEACIVDSSNLFENDKYGVVLRCVHDQLSDGFGCHQDIDQIMLRCGSFPWLSDCARATMPAYAIAVALLIAVIVLSVRVSRLSRGRGGVAEK